MSVAEQERVDTAHELVRRAEELRPLIERNAPHGDEHRRLAEETTQALIDAEIFRATIPRQFGGYQVDIRTKMELSAAVAEGDGATGWVVALINVCNWFACLFSDQAQQDVFGADANARVIGILDPRAETRRVDGGLMVTGAWPFSSGSQIATWAVLGLPLVDEHGKRYDDGLCLIPMSDLTVEDTWFTTGMRGTASNTVFATEVFVPDHRLMPITPAIESEYPRSDKDEPLYRSSFIPVASLILCAPQLGMGRAALRHVIEKATKRTITYTVFERQADSVAFQMEVAEAALRIDTAHLHAWRAADDIDTAAARGEKLDMLHRTRVRADCGWVVRNVRSALELLMTAHGAAAFAEASPLQRIWRDANTSGRHAVASPVIGEEVFGKALLGLDPEITPLV